DDRVVEHTINHQTRFARTKQKPPRNGITGRFCSSGADTRTSTMKISELLRRRNALLRQSRLANLAFVYRRLEQLVTRIACAGLRGEVCLRPGDPAGERPWPELLAIDGSQSVIDEHFTDENILDLADQVVADGEHSGASATFRLEEMASRFLAP